MDLRKAIYAEHTKSNTLQIASYIGTSKQRFAALMEIMQSEDVILAQRAAWIFSHCCDEHPELAQPYTSILFDLLRSPQHVAVRRAITRFLPKASLDEDQVGVAYELSWGFAISNKEDVAIRAHSISLLARVACEYQELQAEVIGLAQDFLKHESAGLRSRAKHVIKKLEKC